MSALPVPDPPSDGPVDDEARRRDVFLAFELAKILAADDPLARLKAEHQSVLARIGDQAMPAVTSPPETIEAVTPPPPEAFVALAPAPAPPAEEPKAAVDVVAAIEARAAAAQAPPDLGTATPPPAPRPSKLPPRPVRPVRPEPRPTPVFDPVAARAQLGRRVELGGWFTGAVFAVGGSLYATNLFWGDIPAALRPAVVGGGLALFAVAFIAMGALLAVRHADSIAGHVLGLVGRLIAVSSAFPLGLLWREAGPVAIVVDVVVMAALFGAMRFGARRAQQPADGPPATAITDGTWLFLAGYAVAILAPEGQAGAVVVGAIAVALLRASVSLRTERALAGRPTFVDDVSAVAICLATLVSDAGAHGNGGLVGCLLAAAFADTALRLVEQRPAMFSIRMLARWTVTLLLFVLACSALADAMDHKGGLGYAAVVIAISSSCFVAPDRLGLPRLFRALYAGGISIAAGFATAAMEMLVGVPFVDAAPLASLVGLIALFGATWPERRALRIGIGEALATLTLFLIAIPTAIAAGDDLGTVPAVLVVAAIFATDRRAERSVWWCLCTIGVLLLALAEALDGIALGHGVKGFLGVAVVVVVVVAALIVRAQRPRWPVIALSSAGLITLFAFGVGAVGTGIDGDPRFAMGLLAGLTLLIVAELVRSVDVAVGATLVLGSLAALKLDEVINRSPLVAAAVVVVVVAALSFLPQLPPFIPRLRSVRVLTRHVTGWSRSPRARALACFRVAAAGALLVAIVGVGSRVGGVDVDGALPCVGLALALLFVRAPGRGVLAALVAALALAIADVGSAPQNADRAVVVAGLIALGVLTLGALLAAVLRAAKVQLPVVRRLVRRRGRREPARDPLWITVAFAGLAAASIGCIGVLLVGESEGRECLPTAMLLGVLCAAQCWSLFAGRAVHALVSLGAVLLACVLPIGFLQALLDEDEPRALSFVVGLVALFALYAVVARLMYAGRSWSRRPPWLLEAWPTPASLRVPAMIGLVSLASSLALFGFALRASGHEGEKIAQRYGPGVVVVVVALIAASAVVIWTRRTLGSGLIVCAIVGLAGGAFDAIAHAAQWMPKSHGMGEAMGALGVVVVVLVLNRRWGRRLLIAARMGLRRSARAGLVNALVVAVPLLVGLAVVLAVDVPGVHAPELWLAGLALVLLVVVEPRPLLGWWATAGLLLVTASTTALMSRSDVLTVSAAPVWLGAMMAMCLAIQSFVQRAWASSVALHFHDEREEKLPAVVGALRAAAEVAGFPILIALITLSVVDEKPDGLALMSTWIGMGLAVVLFSRVAMASQQTFLAAVAQGVALSVYVDIRRRTPWLDDIPGADAIFLLAASFAFLLLRKLARSRESGSAVARAAEAYAVTLPVLAAAVGPNAGARALILMVGGGLYAVLARSRRQARYEVAAGVAVVAACMLALVHADVDAFESYLLPVAFVGTFLARRHRKLMGPNGRWAAVLCHVPLYCSAAWSALRTETFASFAVGILVTTAGVIYAMRVRDRRSLYAASAAALVLVGGRLILAGLDNALLGTLLLAGAGIALLAGMTIFTIKRDVAAAALKGASSRLDHWGDDDDDDDDDDDGSKAAPTPSPSVKTKVD
ncbi:MAG: hypothetical protein Q8O67_27705 [Deltaproteobacteria bacterium]|nr:hypothetical protein [Deltaproteobacteria bacterium]